MKRPVVNVRLLGTGLLCSALLVSAGVIAWVAWKGVVIASIVVTAALLLAGIGFGYARDRTLGVGTALIVAATLPLFGGVYAIGLAIMRNLGREVAGGLLIGIGSAMAAATLVAWLVTRSARRLPR